MKPIKIKILSIYFAFIFFYLNILVVSTAPARNRTRPIKTTPPTLTTKLTTMASPCANVTCHNDGVCVVLGDKWVCACKDGFVGDNCETEYAEFIAQLTTVESTTTEEPSPCDGISCPGGNF